MAASLPAATAAVPVSGSGHSSGESSIEGPHHRRVAFRVPAKPKLWLLASKGSRYSRNLLAIPRAQVNEASFSGRLFHKIWLLIIGGILNMFWNSHVVSKVTVDGSSNSSPTPAKEKVDLKPEPSPSISNASIAEFMTQISGLRKLVDSRDIVELQLKQNDCELVVRKREALPQPPASASVVMMQSPATAIPPQYAPPPPSASSPALPAPGQAPPTAAKAPTSSLPSMKCPMAGIFHRRPEPDEAPFVKVGDQVKKGQTLCIIEAMKMMNEIEAEQSGKIVEVLVEDGEPVSVDMPLFVIEP